MANFTADEIRAAYETTPNGYAVITRSITADTAPVKATVAVIAVIDGVLYYTTDGVWVEFCAPSDVATWDYDNRTNETVDVCELCTRQITHGDVAEVYAGVHDIADYVDMQNWGAPVTPSLQTTLYKTCASCGAYTNHTSKIRTL